MIFTNGSRAPWPRPERASRLRLKFSNYFPGFTASAKTLSQARAKSRLRPDHYQLAPWVQLLLTRSYLLQIFIIYFLLLFPHPCIPSELPGSGIIDSESRSIFLFGEILPIIRYNSPPHRFWTEWQRAELLDSKSDHSTGHSQSPTQPKRDVYLKRRLKLSNVPRVIHRSQRSASSGNFTLKKFILVKTAPTRGKK